MQKRFRKFASVFILATLFGFIFSNSVSASIASGYAWSNNAGWINFGATNGNIQIKDSGITGYAWNETYGWINMSPANSGVKISASGVLSGYAWGEGTSWINFTGTSINCSGHFAGIATGDTVGTITFGCTNCSVITDYRPITCRGGPPPPPVPYCGDASCNGEETCETCPGDCGACAPFCGDGSCNGTETCSTCEVDCGECAPECGDGTCDIGQETCETCPEDCGECPSSCGDGTCNPDKENCNTCPIDCGECPPICGDGKCNGNETCNTCEADCGVCIMPPPPSCGNRICDPGEKCDNCPTDCGACPGGPPPTTCGNNTCDPSESCNTCPTDCGECKPFFTMSCGDGECGISENCYICPEDCGKCEPIPTPIPGIVLPPIIPEKIQKAIETPVGSVATKAITTTGIVTTVAVTALASPFSLLEIFLLPLRLIGLLMIAFGFKKRNPPWGIVYDSVTKQPLDPAYVTLINQSGKEISSAITDLDGRYGFLPEPGFYKMSAKKTNYLFPSQKLSGKTEDELYNNLYFGEEIQGDKNLAITKNIPLDPLKFDWNEFMKKDKRLTNFYSKWDRFFRKTSDFLYYLGFFVAIFAFFAAPYPYNLAIVCLYVFILVLRILGVKPRSFGAIANKFTGNPVAFAILRIFTSDSDREISHKVTDKYGRYFCLVPKGKYYVKIEKKNSDGSYSLIFTSGVINALKTGIIKERFKIDEQQISNPY